MPNISYLNVLFIVIDAIVNICQKQVFIHVPPFCLCKPQSSLFATSINKDGDHCYGKKVISLKLFKFFINCLQNNCGGNSRMFHCPWCGVHAWGPSSNPSSNKLSISLTLTNWRRVKSGQHTIYQCTKFIGWEGSHSERQRSTLMYKHILSCQWLACVKINIKYPWQKLYLSPNLPKLFSLDLAEFVISRFLYRNSCM